MVNHPTNDETWWSGRGAALVVSKDSRGGWTEQVLLTPSTADVDASFGNSVAISDCGCYVAVSAWHDRDGRGSVFVYTKRNGSWVETQKLTPTYTKTKSETTLGNYGHTVIISDTMLAVKAPFDIHSGVRGVVHLYERSGGTFVEVQRLSAPEGSQEESYISPQIALLDGFVLVGAPGLRKVYVFKQMSTGKYQKTAELRASDPGPTSNFGVKIAGDGNNVLVADMDGTTGSSYLFSFEGGVWKEKAKFSEG